MGKTNSKSDITPSFDHNKSVNKSLGDRKKNLPLSALNQSHQAEKNTASSTDKSLRFVEYTIIIWLDGSLEKITESNKKTLDQFHRITNLVQLFSNLEKCVEFIHSVKDEKLFIVVSGALGPELLPRIQNCNQIHSVYLFCGNKARHEQWTKEYRQIKSLHTQLKELSETLRNDIQQYDNSMTPISILPPGPILGLNESNREFLCLQIMKNTLLEIQYDKKFRQEYLNFSRPFYLDNEQQLNLIDHFNESYQVHSPIWWYTRKCFISSMLRRAFLLRDVEIIFKLAFFIRDLHRDIKKSHLQTHNHQFHPITVYRATGMTNTQYKYIEKNQDGLLTFNDFFITTLERSVALKFVNTIRSNDPNTIGIIYKIDVDPEKSSLPYIALNNLSYVPNKEGDILFSMNTIFHIVQISKINERLYEIALTPAGRKDENVKNLVEYMQQTADGLSGWYKLCKIMVEMNEYNQVETIYQYLFQQTNAQHREERAFLQHELGYISDLKNELTNSINHYKQAIEIYSAYLPPTHPNLLATHVNLASVLQKNGDLDAAIDQYQQAFNIEKSDYPNQVIQYNNIAIVLQKQNKFDEAQQTYKKALKILLTDFSSARTILADTYHNMAGMFYSMKDYTQALSYYQKILDIEEKSLPSNHPSLVSTYFNMATAYEGLKDYPKAISYAEKAVQVARLAFGNEHQEAKENLDYLEKLQKTAENAQRRF